MLVLKCADAFAVKTLKRVPLARGFPDSASSAAKYACTEVLIVRAQAIRVRIPTECRGFVANKPSRFCHRRATVILMAKDGLFDRNDHSLYSSLGKLRFSKISFSTSRLSRIVFFVKPGLNSHAPSV